MKRYLFIFIVTLILSISAFAQRGKIQILESGAFHGDEVTALSGEAWFGLFRQGDSFTLLPTVITVSVVNDPIVDGPDEKTGKEVAVLGQESPIFLIKGPGLGQGRVVRTILSEVEYIDNTFDRNLQFEGQDYRLKVENDRPDKENPQYLNSTSKLVLTVGKVKQTLYGVKYCHDCHASIHWAGDLDGDGKLDFYFDLADHYNASGKRLFLSSFAEKGELVKEVAEFWTTGC